MTFAFDIKEKNCIFSLYFKGFKMFESAQVFVFFKMVV